ncbi:eukaryotic translation initiation factor 4G-like isoform X2 [Chenopodium quinoa]|uniref:eukaryotic translation initiation factor 4G-like isoform X2 n=1 Tax=Chenopodium quinoa TaxID=63459 RepID=UPI000B77569F|nr:eukaryotic translation initiation factor 4G-like isoform X2 [Chenopodium quinoa]
MSLNQSRFDKNESQFRKPGGGRSGRGSGGQQRNFPGGRGRGGGSGPTTTTAPPVSNTQSYKKVNHAQGGQSRGNSGPVTPDFNAVTSSRYAENGGHVQSTLQVSNTPSPAGIPKPNDASSHKISRPIPKAPSSQSSSMSSETTLPSTPSKGDGAKGFPLQFGSISPGFMNGMQVPARTSSAPPNLDEQKRDQARREASKAVPAIPLPSAPKQELPKKKVSTTENLIAQESKSKVKRDVHVASASPPSPAHKPSVLPAAGISVPSPFHQQTVSMQFGGPNPQIQSQGMLTSSLQLPIQMPLQMGNPSQVPPQVFVPGLQHPLMQTQGIMHHNQNLGYNPQLAPQLPHQLGNMGINMSAPYNQQQAGNFGNTRKTVKITHPDTHEELRLDNSGSTAPRVHQSGSSQSQPVPPYTGAHPMGYYSSSYTTGPPFFSAQSSLPLTSAQLNASSQGPRFSYPVSQAQPTMPFMNQSASNTYSVSRAGATIHGAPDSSSLDQVREAHNIAPSAQSTSVHVTVKAAGGSAREKAINSSAVERPELSKVLNPAVEPSVARKDSEINVDNSAFQPNSSTAHPKHSATMTASVATESSSLVEVSAISDTIHRESAAIAPPVNGVKRETSSKSVPIKDIEKNPGKQEHPESSQQVDGKSESRVSQDLVDSSEVVISESAEPRSTQTASDSKLAILEAGQSSPSDVHGDGIGTEAPSHSSESYENQDIASKDQATNKDDLPSQEKAVKESSDAKERGENELDILQSDSSLKGSDIAKDIDRDEQLMNAADVKGVMETSQREVESAESCVQVDNLMEIRSCKNDSSIISDGCGLSEANTLSVSTDGVSCKGDDVSKSGMSDNEATSVSADLLDTHLGHEEIMENSRPNSSSGTTSGSNKGKNKGKKKWKELLQKADALGTSSDLYMAYKGPEEKKESSVATELAADDKSKEVSGDVRPEESSEKNKEEQIKAELDDWEDAAEIATPKLESSIKGGHGGSVHDEDGVTAKKYSRDFLLTFSAQCTNLPERFEITSDLEALMSENTSASRSDREHPSAGRTIDRPAAAAAARPDRRVSGTLDADRWNKQPGPFPSVRDPGMDLAYGSNIMGFRGGPGPNYGVLRNPRAQGPVPHVGGILSGPMHSMGFLGMQRNNSDADRWQRATNFNKGLMPAPQGPSQIMHKAERKYEIGKISDEEEAKQRKLKGILNKLTPQNFEKLFEQVKEVNIDNSVTLAGVISQIFDKALTEPTFCEMYANFCQHLASELPELSVDNQKITFRRLLLNKCQEEFERGEREEQEANKADNEGEDEPKQSEAVREEMRLKARRRMLGNIRLIGELYKKRMLTERIMHECIKKLLGQYQNPDEENIEALCKLMSTIGEMIDHPKAKEHMDAYFDIMGQLSNNTRLSSRVRFMLRDAIDLRKNKWQQRRKVEGPKKIDEVHRDAAQERQVQTSRLNRGPSMNSGMRRGQPMDFGPRAPMISSPIGQGGGFRGMPSQLRGFGGQDSRIDERNIFESRGTPSVPLPQRLSSDETITLGPQGGLARGMAYRGQPSMSNSPLLDNTPSYVDSRRMIGGLNGYSNVPDRGAFSSREDQLVRNPSDRFVAPVAYDQSSSQEHNTNRDARYPDQNLDRARPLTPTVARVAPALNVSPETVWPEERLREMSISAIREYYSANDEKEVALCIKDLNAPSFYPTVISAWVTDSFERKDLERDMLSRLLVNLTRPREGIFSPGQLVEGFKSVLTTLEDTVTDAPKAPEFLGRIFASVVIENLVPLKDVGRLIQEGGEEPGCLRESGLAAEILGSVLDKIKSEQGETVLKDIRAGSNLRLEDFRPPEPIRSRKLEMFM